MKLTKRTLISLILFLSSVICLLYPLSLNIYNNLNLRKENTAFLEGLWNGEQGKTPVGILEIPKLKTQLLIYDNTDDSTLELALGLYNGSSQIGEGKGANVVVIGHRGTHDRELFRNLDKLSIGDTFKVISKDNKKTALIYQITGEETVEPDEINKLEPQKEKDLVTLVTCTPYLINSHRLIYYGEKIGEEPYNSSVKIPLITMGKEYNYFVIGYIVIIFSILIFKFIRKRKKCKK